MNQYLDKEIDKRFEEVASSRKKILVLRIHNPG
jgi:hypothetical protein